MAQAEHGRSPTMATHAVAAQVRVGMVETGEAPSPATPSGLWVPYPVKREWGAYAVAWKQAA